MPRTSTAPKPLPNQQVAALCVRQRDGGVEVLLVTSRDTGRWILPKGWPMPDRSMAQAALQEAWEEAGVRGVVHEQSVGSFEDIKRMDSGERHPVRLHVFRVDVEVVLEDYPEAGQRQRRWLPPLAAASMVRMPGLAVLLREFGQDF